MHVHIWRSGARKTVERIGIKYLTSPTLRSLLIQRYHHRRVGDRYENWNVAKLVNAEMAMLTRFKNKFIYKGSFPLFFFLFNGFFFFFYISYLIKLYLDFNMDINICITLMYACSKLNPLCLRWIEQLYIYLQSLLVIGVPIFFSFSPKQKGSIQFCDTLVITICIFVVF